MLYGHLQSQAEGEGLLGPTVLHKRACSKLALVCALKGNQMLFWEFLNVCIEVVIGY